MELSYFELCRLFPVPSTKVSGFGMFARVNASKPFRHTPIRFRPFTSTGTAHSSFRVAMTVSVEFGTQPRVSVSKRWSMTTTRPSLLSSSRRTGSTSWPPPSTTPSNCGITARGSVWRRTRVTRTKSIASSLIFLLRVESGLFRDQKTIR